MENELLHYGILGMKWGVRRYQNYDGSYTQKGLARYRDSEKRYQSAKEVYKGTDRNTLERSKAKRELKDSRRKLNESYKHLKEDYIADKGKDLYKSGKTISDNNMTRNRIEGSLILGSVAGSLVLAKNGHMRIAQILPGTVILGSKITETIIQNKNKKLRAYYGHSQWKG